MRNVRKSTEDTTGIEEGARSDRRDPTDSAARREYQFPTSVDEIVLMVFTASRQAKKAALENAG
jgi:hypothetical protein